MKEHFNEYVKSIETYIMFRIKQEAARLAPELEAKGRAPIALAMGATCGTSATICLRQAG